MAGCRRPPASVLKAASAGMLAGEAALRHPISGDFDVPTIG